MDVGTHHANDMGVAQTGSSDVVQTLSQMEGFFTENLGQLGEGAGLFYALGDPLSVAFGEGWVAYSLRNEDARDREGVLFRITFEGGDQVAPVGIGCLAHRTSFFTGNDPEAWVAGARNFREILYGGVYDGVDVRFYFNQGMLKYDILVDADAEIDRIAMRYDGIERLDIDEPTGDLLIVTEMGTLRDARPIVFQDPVGSNPGANGRFRLIEGDLCGFEIPAHLDPILPMVIDPGLQFSTYLGGSSKDGFSELDIDGDGNLYVIGYTHSNDFPTTSGAYNEGLNGLADVYITKVLSSGSSLAFSTYIGGSDNNDYGYAIDVASDGSVYAAGATYSDGFPTTDDAYNRTPGASLEAFFLRLSKDGSNLLYSSYFGGDDEDAGTSICVDGQGQVLLFGETSSSDLPVSQGAFCTTYSSQDIFVLKMDSSLSRVIYCTYIGGDDLDEIGRCRIDASGNAFIIGGTSSGNFPVTAGAFCTTKRDASRDGFVLKLDPTGSHLIYSTFLGGNRTDGCIDLRIGRDGRAYVTGSTLSADFPITHDAIASTISGAKDGFLAIVDSAGSALSFSTFIGGSKGDTGTSIAVDPKEEVVSVLGYTSSEDLPIPRGAFDPQYRGGDYDLFVITVNITPPSVSYCTYLGGEDYEDTVSGAMAMDENGHLIVAGKTDSLKFPVTSGAFDNTYSGGVSDVCLAKIDPEPCDVPDPPWNLQAEAGDTVVLLNWHPPRNESCRVLAYRLYKGPTPEAEQFIAEVVNETGYTDVDVVNGRTYHYRVSTVTSAGEGPFSDAVQARPLGLPTTPLDLQAFTGNGTVTLNWSPPENTGGEEIGGYYIYRGPFSLELELWDTVGNVSSYVDRDVEVGEFYFYKVQAFNSRGGGALSDFIRIKPLDVPSAPLDFWITPGDGQVQLSWKLPTTDGGSMLLGFHIWRGTSQSDMAIIATKLLTDLNYVDKDVVNGRAYVYYVTAFSEVGEGRPTTALDAIPFGLPTRPRIPVAEAWDGQITINWTLPESLGGRPLIGYRLYWGESPGDLKYKHRLGNVTGFRHAGLTNGVTYYYQLTAVNEAGEGPPSIVVSATPMGFPGMPSSFTAESIAGGVKLNWVAPLSKGGADTITYRVLRDVTDDPETVLVEIVDAFEYLDTDVVQGSTYYYRVVAVNAMGAGQPTETIAVTVRTAPGQVADLIAVAGNGIVELTWSAPDDGDSPIAHFIILRGIFETGLEEVGRVSGATLNYTDGFVENGKTYYYRVYAINAIGGGPRSEVLAATPLAPPSAPGALNAKVEGDTIVLTWAAPVVGDRAPVTGYRVYRGTSEVDLRLLAELADVHTYTDEDVEKGKTYYYCVAAKSDVGQGEMAPPVKVEIKKKEDGPAFQAITVLAAMGIAALVVLSRRRSDIAFN